MPVAGTSIVSTWRRQIVWLRLLSSLYAVELTCVHKAEPKQSMQRPCVGLTRSVTKAVVKHLRAGAGHLRAVAGHLRAVAELERAVAELVRAVAELVRAVAGHLRAVAELVRAVAGHLRAVAELVRAVAELVRAVAGHLCGPHLASDPCCC